MHKLQDFKTLQKEVACTLPETNIAFEKCWLVDYFPFWEGVFLEAIGFREGSTCSMTTFYGIFSFVLLCWQFLRPKTTSHLLLNISWPVSESSSHVTGHDRSKGRSWETKLSKTEVATQNHHLLSRNIWPFASFCSACYKKYEYIIKILHNCVTVNVFHQIPKTSSCLHLQRWLAPHCTMLRRNLRWPPHFPPR